jgi:hypothetical protein
MVVRTSQIFAITLGILLLVGVGSSLTTLAVLPERSGDASAICKPLWWAFSRDEANRQAQEIRDFAARKTEFMHLLGSKKCHAGQYAAAPEYPVATIRCRPLPPTKGPELSNYLADALQDLSLCPAGQFPMRYGSGKDLGADNTCVAWDKETAARKVPWNWEGFGSPIEDPYSASDWAEGLSKVKPCPPEMDEYWEGKPPPRGMGGPPPPPQALDWMRDPQPVFRPDAGILP